MGRVYDDFEKLSMGGDGDAPLDFFEALYQSQMNEKMRTVPNLEDHFENSAHLGSFVKDKESNRDYNIESGYDYAKTTGSDFWKTIPNGLGYAIIDSFKNKDQDFFDMEGGIGDFFRNMQGVGMATDTNPFGLLYTDEEKENLIGEYLEKMKKKKKNKKDLMNEGGIITL
mgnify:FL=1